MEASAIQQVKGPYTYTDDQSDSPSLPIISKRQMENITRRAVFNV
jgi:hypothetical protein